MSRKEYLAKLIKLHDFVDNMSESVIIKSGIDFKCGAGCTDCCVDDITVFEIEAERIISDYSEVLRMAPGPIGKCALLGTDGDCRIYSARPYVCRTQGLPLRWIGQTDDGKPAEFRDICPLNDHGAPIETLPEDSCFTLGPFESELRRLQIEFSDGKLVRIALRKLFEPEGK